MRQTSRSTDATGTGSAVIDVALELVVDGIDFGEGPRWPGDPELSVGTD